ncbi:lipopolysaccharide biosynthesis protein [Hallella mizrahii]|uniref:lipopolysaccharide biosynthesis protein n=1 Tax=Hallella mizrahii TaxID=2606637 RepID=UPI0019811F53|nr:polysaccharide biosynthesis protein [Hallella mizrahii]
MQEERKTKKIASNTIILFIRMMAIMVINLYAVRVVLNGLGQEDYGIFNAIAGVVLTSTFISSSLAIAIQRFYSFALGQHQSDRLQSIFSASINIVVVLAVIIIVVFETAGIWFIEHRMTIPLYRMDAVHWLFQMALFTFTLSFLQIPFTASIFANEDMGYYAGISFLECIGRLLVALLIASAPLDRLMFYSSGLLLVALLTFSSYGALAIYKYGYCRYNKIKDKGIYKQLLSFSGWTIYGTFTGVGLIQGHAILLNMFFGPLANAAFSIANQAYNAFNTLSNSIVLAFRPAMIKAYSGEDKSYLDTLFQISNKFILYLLIAVSIPFICETREILYLWLGRHNTTELTVLMTRLFAVYCVCQTIHNPITIIIQATGKIKYYYSCVESVTVLAIPVSWLLFHLRFPVFFGFVSIIAFCIFAHGLRLAFLKHYYSSFNLCHYIMQFILPATIVAAAVLFITRYARELFHAESAGYLLQIFLVFATSVPSTLVLTYLLGLTHTEKQELRNYVKGIARKYL